MESVGAMKEVSCSIDEGSQESRLHPPSFHHASYQLRQLAIAIRNVAQTYADGGSLLDYGCGSMPYKPVFAERVDEYHGADLATNDCADVLLSSTGTLPLQSARFEIVLSTQVLEHVEDPALYLTEAQRVLKEDGVIILSTHGSWHYHPTPQDYWRWTSTGLRKVIEDAGFKVVFFKGIMGDAATATQLWQDALLVRLPRWMGFGFKFIMQKVVALQDRMISQESKDTSACVYVVVARKLPLGEGSSPAGNGAISTSGLHPSHANGQSPEPARTR